MTPKPSACRMNPDNALYKELHEAIMILVQQHVICRSSTFVKTMNCNILCISDCVFYMYVTLHAGTHSAWMRCNTKLTK